MLVASMGHTPLLQFQDLQGDNRGVQGRQNCQKRYTVEPNELLSASSGKDSATCHLSSAQNLVAFRQALLPIHICTSTLGRIKGQWIVLLFRVLEAQTANPG